MANPSKDAGTKQETKICRTINDYAGEKVAERLAQHGKLDQGDIRIVVGDLVLTGESKHSKRYPSEGLMDEYKDQTVKETAHAGSDGGVLFVNLPNRSIERMECHMLKSTYVKLVGMEYFMGADVPQLVASVLRSVLLEDDPERDWLCIPMSTFLRIAFGHDRKGPDHDD